MLLLLLLFLLLILLWNVTGGTRAALPGRAGAVDRGVAAAPQRRPPREDCAARAPVSAAEAAAAAVARVGPVGARGAPAARTPPVGAAPAQGNLLPPAPPNDRPPRQGTRTGRSKKKWLTAWRSTGPAVSFLCHPSFTCSPTVFLDFESKMGPKWLLEVVCWRDDTVGTDPATAAAARGGPAEAAGHRAAGAAQAHPRRDEGARDDVPRVDAHLAAARPPARHARPGARQAAQVPGAGEEALQGTQRPHTHTLRVFFYSFLYSSWSFDWFQKRTKRYRSTLFHPFVFWFDFCFITWFRFTVFIDYLFTANSLKSALFLGSIDFLRKTIDETGRSDGFEFGSQCGRRLCNYFPFFVTTRPRSSAASWNTGASWRSCAPAPTPPSRNWSSCRTRSARSVQSWAFFEHQQQDQQPIRTF